ncbi:hypothetical protein F5J12DRAFT_823128 [Pisolithus orientalis]|uniref:uncharacterized protein n=1 Tax=Pisolithus orientalis TaxID=936130 RepID=UPI002225227F|nr:uncharacterized protein F5J12DRAFT_823128 [Pisolithus orientalis]KAI6010967.1 hypothetical protein F5J12DRAFT_823128 [Pisolithus orientalis]
MPWLLERSRINVYLAPLGEQLEIFFCIRHVYTTSSPLSRPCKLHQRADNARQFTTAASIQSQKIPVAVIDCLPLELFSRILHFALSMTSQREWRLHPRQKQQLAGVSRRWRDVILNTPSLWSTICTRPIWALLDVEMHVERSRDHPLDIIVFEWWYSYGFVAFLHPILPYTHRWRSLTIHTGVADPHSLLHDLSELSFPCLKRVNVQGSRRFDVEFPTADSTPVLNQLIIQNCRLPKSLLPSLEKLTTLALCGEIDIDNPSMLVKAIVAPELSCFDFNFDESAAVFGGIPSAFNKVHYVCLRSSTRNPIATVCQAFPNVRHFEMGEHACGFFHGLRERTDLWVDLESITLCSLRIDVLEGAVNELREWFLQRKPTAKPLHNPTCWKRTGRVPSCVVNVRLEQDVPWRESTDDFQNVSEDESSEIAKDDDLEDNWGDWWADSDVDYGNQ